MHTCTATGCSDSTARCSGRSTSSTAAEDDTQDSERLSQKGSSVSTKHGAKTDFVKRNIEVHVPTHNNMLFENGFLYTLQVYLLLPPY